MTRLSKWGLTIAAIVLLGAGMAFYAFYARNETETAVRTSGTVEGIEVNLAPKVAGRISQICCNEGDRVQKGQVAIRLEGEDLKAAVAQAIAGVERANANVMVAMSSVTYAKANVESAEAEIITAQADMEKAKVQMEEAERKMSRSVALFKQQFISREELDTAVLAYDVSAADCTSSQSKIVAANSKRDATAAQLRTAENQLDLAKADLRQAEANLAYNRAKLADTTIASPISGTVVFKALEKGETVSPGQTVLTVVDLAGLYARVDIDETMVGGIVLNSEANVTTEGKPARTFKGRVSEIGRYAEFATQRDVTRGRQDIKTFRVKIAVEDPTGFLKPGMTVNVEIPRKPAR